MIKERGHFGAREKSTQKGWDRLNLNLWLLRLTELSALLSEERREWRNN